ncbi:MAG: hypothetical protein AMJ38_03150 [Dehalococcoidia bacterium DG_22]|nr:MAG: hypothetical protein AMJ38_03150 [Dehalococcoidia bacterium DG_22]
MRTAIIVFIGAVIGLVIAFAGFTITDDDVRPFDFPTPTSEPTLESQCTRLNLLAEDLGQRCLQEVDQALYEDRYQYWLNKIEEQGISGEEAIAGFSAWLSTQGENCRLWQDALKVLMNSNCP